LSLFPSNDPPDQSTSVAGQELLLLVERNPAGLTPLDLLSDLNVNQVDLVEEVMRMRSLEDSIASAFTCTSLPRFNAQVKIRILLKVTSRSSAFCCAC